MDKYGRLFTEADVQALVARFAHECGVYGTQGPEVLKRLLDEGFSTTFPADEPVFVLRGKDGATPAALYGYVDYLKHVLNGATFAEFEHGSFHPGALKRHMQSAEEFNVELSAWQRANPDRVKVPD